FSVATSTHRRVWKSCDSLSCDRASKFHSNHLRRNLHHARARPLLRCDSRDWRSARPITPAPLPGWRNGTLHVDLRRATYDPSNLERDYSPDWGISGHADKTNRDNGNGRKSVAYFRCRLLNPRFRY